jgi:excisionase family DNA binding protein
MSDESAPDRILAFVASLAEQNARALRPSVTMQDVVQARRVFVALIENSIAVDSLRTPAVMDVMRRVLDAALDEAIRIDADARRTALVARDALAHLGLHPPSPPLPRSWDELPDSVLEMLAEGRRIHDEARAEEDRQALPPTPLQRALAVATQPKSSTEPMALPPARAPEIATDMDLPRALPPATIDARTSTVELTNRESDDNADDDDQRDDENDDEDPDAQPRRRDVPPIDPNAEYLSIAQAAQLAQVSEQTIRKWRRQGLLGKDQYSAGRHKRIRRADLDAYMRGGTKRTPPDPDEQAARLLARGRAKRKDRS